MPQRPSHFDDQGQARMVDVSAKPVTTRRARAAGDVVMRAATGELIRAGNAKKGDVLGIARLAAIQATKWTPQLIPLCHAIPIESVDVEFRWEGIDPGTDGPNADGPNADGPNADGPDISDAETRTGIDSGVADSATLSCLVTVGTSAKTGVEMEAMTAATLACLTVYDMIKSVDREVSIGPVRLLEKSGGKSGDFRRETPP